MKIPQGEYVPVRITGLVGEDTLFVGADTIRTIRPTVTHPKGGETVSGDSPTNVTWVTPAGVSVDVVDVYWSPNDGVDWLAIADMVPNTESVPWVVPITFNDQCRVMVTLYRDGEDVGSGMSQDVFSIDAPVAVALASFDVVGGDRSAQIRWATSIEVGSKGFHILRAESEDEVFERVNEDMIPATGAGSRGAVYAFNDVTVRPNTTYYYKLKEINAQGEEQQFGPFEFRYAAQFRLEQNIPNPFNPTTVIRFTVPEDALVSLKVFDVAGRLVRTLASEKRQANHYEIQWDGRDGRGQQVASGVYFYRLIAGKYRDTKKMLMLK
jgi:hypothetical protein